ncbi:MAG: hypothetical protein WBK77_01675 [Alphaproteobacteria bacterium]
MSPDDPDRDTLDAIMRNRELIRRRLQSLEARPENGQVFQEDDKTRLGKSHTGIILYTHKILKCGMTVLFLLSIICMTFLLYILGWMLFEYVSNLIKSPEELQKQLAHIWTALSGAFVVVFFQFIVSIGKKLSINGSEKG